MSLCVSGHVSSPVVALPQGLSVSVRFKYSAFIVFNCTSGPQPGPVNTGYPCDTGEAQGTSTHHVQSKSPVDRRKGTGLCIL
jgi:hypothetical protein